MAVFTNIDIKKRRELLNMTAATLADKIGCDAHTVYNWESSKCDPDPNTMYLIAEAFGDLDIWDSWMRTKYWAYAKIHPEAQQNQEQGAAMKMFAEIADVVDCQREAMRDLSDGKFDDPAFRERFLKECGEAAGSINILLRLLQSKPT